MPVMETEEATTSESGINRGDDGNSGGFAGYARRRAQEAQGEGDDGYDESQEGEEGEGSTFDDGSEGEEDGSAYGDGRAREDEVESEAQGEGQEEAGSVSVPILSPVFADGELAAQAAELGIDPDKLAKILNLADRQAAHRYRAGAISRSVLDQQIDSAPTYFKKNLPAIETQLQQMPERLRTTKQGIFAAAIAVELETPENLKGDFKAFIGRIAAKVGASAANVFTEARATSGPNKRLPASSATPKAMATTSASAARTETGRRSGDMIEQFLGERFGLDDTDIAIARKQIRSRKFS